MLLVTSKIKAYAKEKHEMRLGKDYLDKLSSLVEKLIDESCDGAKSDKRGTVKERDLCAHGYVMTPGD